MQGGPSLPCVCVNCARVYVCFHKKRTRMCIYISLLAHEVMNLRRDFFLLSSSQTRSFFCACFRFIFIQETYLFTRRGKKKDPATALVKAQANARESVQRAGQFREQRRYDIQRESARARARVTSANKSGRGVYCLGFSVLGFSFSV